jgi:hypothetical protein
LALNSTLGPYTKPVIVLMISVSLKLLKNTQFCFDGKIQIFFG